MKKLLQLLAANAKGEAPSKIKAEAGKVYVYGVIDSDWGASAQGLIEALKPMAGQPVELHVNSPGGDVFEARAMVAAIRAHGAPVTVYIDGLAASAATYLALSGDQVHITAGGMFMVHNSWTLAWGNKHEMRSTAELLDKIDSTIKADYARKTGAEEAQIAAWMDAETWFTAEEAKAAGFVDSIVGAGDKNAAAQWNLSAYANAPALQPATNDDAALSANAERVARLNRSRFAALVQSQN